MKLTFSETLKTGFLAARPIFYRGERRSYQYSKLAIIGSPLNVADRPMMVYFPGGGGNPPLDRYIVHYDCDSPSIDKKFKADFDMIVKRFDNDLMIGATNGGTRTSALIH